MKNKMSRESVNELHTSMFKRERGITLIALVLTIIVLLIFATVSIQAVLGENGITTKAQTAKQQTETEIEKEQINVSFVSCKMENSDETGDNALVTASQLQTEMNNSYGTGIVEVTGTESIIIVKYQNSEREYLLTQSGVVINYAEASSADGTIGIAEDGSIVDMSLWTYIYSNELDGYILASVGYFPGYRGIIEDGRIQGEIPMYILGIDDGTNPTTFKTVKSLENTFTNIENLIYPPQIPSSVIRMDATFAWCIDLIEMPTIPRFTESLNGCFYRCESLTKASEIPASVDNLFQTFYSCNSLTGELKIDANPSEYIFVFDDAATNEGCDLALTGSSTMLEEMLTTKSENSNIRIGN